MNKYRIEAGTVYQWDADNRAYVCIGKTIQYTKKELKAMRNYLLEELIE